MIGVDEARRLVAASIPPPVVEEIDLGHAEGRVLARPFDAPFDLPRFDNSAMDGYAVAAADVAGATASDPVNLRVVGLSAAGGGAPPTIEPGHCAQVMTGALLPRGSDSVVMVERTSGYADDRVAIYEAARSGQNIRRRGEEVHAGSTLLPAGSALDPSALGVLAGFGWSRVEAYRRPRLALLVSGDELRQPGQPLEPGQIYDSTTPVLTRVAGREADVVLARGVPDQEQALADALKQAQAAADVIVVSGGVSMGRFDHVKQVSRRVGFEQQFWGVAQKPGKPLLFALGQRETLLFGLPGNPVSSLICLLEYVCPALRQWQGAPPQPKLLARLSGRCPRERSKHRFLFGVCRTTADGLEVSPSDKRGSHMLTAALGASCICEAPPGDEPLERGAQVSVSLLPWARLEPGDQELRTPRAEQA